MEVCARRTKQALTLIAGLKDDESPLSMLDMYLVRRIMRKAYRPYRVVTADGDQEWHDIETGQLHNRDDEPAEILADGTRRWFKNGRQHRDDDKPAETRKNGTQIWYRNGRKHRDGNKPAEINSSGSCLWYKEGKLDPGREYPALLMFGPDLMQFKHDELRCIVSDNFELL